LEIFTGFVIGLLGSLHCIGMCGPIALALPTGPAKSLRFYSGRLLYNFGRVITYSLFGLIFGLIGKNLAVVGLQRWVSITSGILIIIVVLLPRATKTGLIMKLPFGKVTQKIKEAFGNLFRKGSLSSMLFIGIVNGFLPCGFVYVGIAGALAVGDVGMGVVYMALFGLGTIPVMFVTSVAGNFISIGIRQKLTKIIPVLAIILAVLFILRGMNLGIMYISPKTDKMMNGIPAEQMKQDTMKTKDCCK
jgi:sulfite exporter TauE/SafE